MTENAWDKLWKERPHIVEIGIIGEQFLDKVKVEGDRLKDKVDKWGKTLSELGVSYEAEGEWWFDPEKWNKLKDEAEE